MAVAPMIAPSHAFGLDLSAQIGGGSTDGALVHAQNVEDKMYLFLPAQADSTRVVLKSGEGNVEVWSNASGQFVSAVDGVNLIDLGIAEQDGSIPPSWSDATIRIAGVESSLTIMKSANIRSAFVTMTVPILNRVPTIASPTRVVWLYLRPIRTKRISIRKSPASEVAAIPLGQAATKSPIRLN